MPLFLLILITAIAAWVLPSGLWRQVPTFALLWLWPALIWSRWLPGRISERLISGAGLALLLNVLLALLLHLIPGPVPRVALLATSLLVALMPLARVPRTPAAEQPASPLGSRRRVASVVAVLLLALLLRLPGLDYKEFQGDEGVIMVRAAAALTGDDDQLFFHKNGPVEILIPLTVWGLSGTTNELAARLPFAWAGWLGVIALMVLAHKSNKVRFLSVLGVGLLFAVNGFAVAFSRIVQYQSLIVLWGALSLLHALRYRDDGRVRDLLLAALFLAGGLLAHYDAILVLPAVAWVLLDRVWLTRDQWRSHLRHWSVAALAAGLLLALFYIPFFLNPVFSSTSRYLFGDRLGQDATSSSGGAIWQMVTFYNSTYTIVGLLLLLLAGFAATAFRDGGSGRRQRSAHIALLLYLAVPLLFYTFVVADPRTHIYTIFPAATIWAGYGLNALARAWPRVRGARPAGVVLFTLFVGVSAFYVYLLFADTTAERQRNWSEQRLSFYPATWDEPPREGLFGFPYQGGWRVAGSLLEGLPYASNEEEEITNWYMSQALRTNCSNFKSFLLVENVQDPVPYDAAVLARLHLQHTVSVNGRPVMNVYGESPVASVQQHEASGRSLWRTPEEVAPPVLDGAHSVGVVFGERARLRGYDIDTDQAYPGGQVTIVLYWEALATIAESYRVFVHLYDGTTVYAQHDGRPECGFEPTSAWKPGQFFADPHIVELPADMPLGEVPVLVGMYLLDTGERLAVDTNGNSLLLTTLQVRPAPEHDGTGDE